MSTTAVPQLLRLEQVAQLLGMSRRGVYALVERGDLQVIYLDRRPKFVEADVLALVNRARERAGKGREP
jgi:predicted DNA-binding transcriptional regulator AlpA